MLQRKAKRIVSFPEFNAHTNPLFSKNKGFLPLLRRLEIPDQCLAGYALHFMVR